MSIKEIKEQTAPAIPPHDASSNHTSRQIPVILGPIIIAIILAILWLPQLTNNAAATVNGESISRSEFDRRVAFERLWSEWNGTPIPATGPEATQFRTNVLDTMVENRVILQEAKKAGIVITPQDVASRIAAVESDLKLSDAQVNAALTQAGLTRQTFENIIHEDLIVDRFLRTVVLKDVAAADQQTAVLNWYNSTLAKAKIEKRIESGGARVGQPAPDFTLNDLDGKPVRLSDLKGKPVVINFFATWCNPCRAEMPDFEALWKDNKDRGLIVLAVNLTNQDNVNDVRTFVKELSLTFPIVLDENGTVASLYRVGPIPSSYFINKSGILTAVQVGSMSRQTMDQRVAKLLQ